ncbi:DctP family TRAP transporter solute-binding subunit [Billgrantia kenyensis]|uniref:DctP family TRAP transporter solute-binding subunit n=1 Tax=Billgrantia kenyensis TaxID=321266 RepID=A0A7V9VZW7_9GAMM|nr:DctP family TRAP transporter solute-binding subunit [Halomonas kenyensis]MBA2778427.1 DctP family TRAP transporter solute-binding subunit [Halomonas kenyensis]MCG6660733.1 DctP family TRAP transporter solute-binding subunit [Halomonas kenyensis]
MPSIGHWARIRDIQQQAGNRRRAGAQRCYPWSGRSTLRQTTNREGAMSENNGIKALSLATLGVCLAFPLTSLAMTITIAHEEPANAQTSAAHLSAMVFKDVIETQSNGEMSVDIQAASSMGNQRDRMELTQAGIIDVNVASIGGLSQFYPNMNAIDLPFAFPDTVIAERVFDGDFGERLSQQLHEATGLHLLAVTAGDFYVFTNSKQPVRSPDDMEGLRVRTMSVPSHITMMNALGAAATPVPWDELYGAMETGVVDAQHNPIPIMAIGNLQEVQDYATLTNHLYGADWWVASDDFLSGLSDDQRRIFHTAVETAKVAGRGAKLGLRATQFGTEYLQDAGLEVYSPSPEELARFRELAVPAVMSSLEEEFGQQAAELAQAMLEAVEEVEAALYGGR